MTATPTRETILARAETVVVKVGTNVLADARGHLDAARIRALVTQVARAKEAGRRVALVTSGAIGAGVGRLKLPGRPADLAHLQACAAVGQSALMQLYEEEFARHGLHAAQLLLTAGDFDNRPRYLNVRNTLSTLFEYACVPVVNENDTVSVAEIRFGDNDQLAAMVANLLQAPLLVLLTNVDGLYSADPRSDPSAKLLATVEEIDPGVTEMAGATKSALGSGGMRSKLRAARVATEAGCAVVVANGSLDGILDRVLGGEEIGTLFLPRGTGLAAWKRWLGYTAQPKGELVLDAGAVAAVTRQGKSLLPVGVTQVRGDFAKGDVVSLVDGESREVARGLTNYSAAEAVRAAGRKSDEITALLGAVPYAELVHRDNLVTLR